jgi:hypothetical protein
MNDTAVEAALHLVTAAATVVLWFIGTQGEAAALDLCIKTRLLFSVWAATNSWPRTSPRTIHFWATLAALAMQYWVFGVFGAVSLDRAVAHTLAPVAVGVALSLTDPVLAGPTHSLLDELATRAGAHPPD